MAVPYYGDYPEDHTKVIIPFNTFTSDDPSASATITDFVAGDVKIYKDGGDTEKASADGITITVDFDSTTGNHLIIIDTSNDTGSSGFWIKAKEYQVRINGTTVDGATINAWVGCFSIERAGGALALIKALNNLSQAEVLSDATPINGTNVNTLSGHDPGATICADGTPLTSQEARDAMKLAPTGNSPAAGSVDKHLDDIDGTAATPAEVATALTNYGANTVTPDAVGAAATLHGVTDGLIGGLNNLSSANVTAAVPTAVAIRTEMDSNSTQLSAIVTDTGYIYDNACIADGSSPAANSLADAVRYAKWFAVSEWRIDEGADPDTMVVYKADGVTVAYSFTIYKSSQITYRDPA